MLNAAAPTIPKLPAPTSAIPARIGTSSSNTAPESRGLELTWKCQAVARVHPRLVCGVIRTDL
jgi:hypothetical protein